MNNLCGIRGLGLLVGLLTGSAAWSQDAPPSLDGAWAASVKVPATGREYQGNARLAAGEGHWQFAVKNSGDPCVGLRVPLAWRRTEGGDVELKSLVSKALTGCADGFMLLKQVDANTLQGRTASGLDVTLKRNP